MSLVDVWKLFQPLLAGVESALGGLASRAAGLLPKGQWTPPAGIPAWALIGGVVLGGWAIAEALAGVLKAAVRIGALALAAVIVIRVLG